MRFPEFSGEWDSCDLQSLCSPISAGHDKPDDGLYRLYGSTGVIGTTSNASYNKQLVLIARVGANAGYMQIVDEPCGVTDNTLVVEAKDWNRYIFYYLQHYNLNKLIFGSGQPLITGGMLKKVPIRYGSLYERERIVKLLSIIDDRITTQIRIIEELKLYRNTLMFKLLTPKDKWLRLSIGDVAQVIGGGTPDTNIEDYWNGNIQWFTPSEIGKEKYVTESERTLTQKGLDNSSAKFLPPGTILLSTRATIGECSIAKQECCTNQGFQSLIAKKVTPEFLYYLIQTKKKDLLSKASGSTFAEISANEVRKINICIPNTQEEQKAIVQPLSAYDERIETECKILHLYELQKQYLLGQMFI